MTDPFEVSKAAGQHVAAPGAARGGLKRSMAASLSLAPGPKRRGLGSVGTKAAKVGATSSSFLAPRGHLVPKAGGHRAHKLGEVMERTGDAGRALKQSNLIERGVGIGGGSNGLHGGTAGALAHQVAGGGGHVTEALTHSRGLGHLAETGLTVAQHLLMKNASGHDAFEVRDA